MILLIPEPKKVEDFYSFSEAFNALNFLYEDGSPIRTDLIELAKERFWNRKSLVIRAGISSEDKEKTVFVKPSLVGIKTSNDKLFHEQGYDFLISSEKIVLCYEDRRGFINALTSIKQLLIKQQDGTYILPLCHITDYPSIPVRAVATTFSWYAGYGRFGFDSQLWGYEKWEEFLNICVDNKINQLNLVMYGYWPFELKGYEETVLRNIPIKIWNAENRGWLTVRYTHPNIEEPFLGKFIQKAHKLGVKIFAYVGLNSYNGGYSIKHPKARMKPPKGKGIKNDFDSLCLSQDENVIYIIRSMEQIARLGFDGYTLEESEEGFWFCTCDACKKRWLDISKTPG